MLGQAVQIIQVIWALFSGHVLVGQKIKMTASIILFHIAVNITI